MSFLRIIDLSGLAARLGSFDPSRFVQVFVSMEFDHSSFQELTGLPDILGYLFIFGGGLLVGSFLNVVIHRIPARESIIFPNSKCPQCGSAIKPYDNIPLFSWLLLRGKCRACKAPISFRYPGVELLNALIWVGMYWAFGPSWFLIVALVFGSVMLCLIFIDAEHMILPNVITYPLFFFALIARLLVGIFPESVHFFKDLTSWPASAMFDYPLWCASLVSGSLGALAGGGSLWLVGELWKRLRGVDAMGLGDVKMMFGVGMLLGWKATLLSIFFASFVGALAGVIFLGFRKDKNMQSQIPFGIFLGTGSLISFVFGEALINWYLRVFVP